MPLPNQAGAPFCPRRSTLYAILVASHARRPRLLLWRNGNPASRPYPGTTLKFSAVCLYLFVLLSMSIEMFFGFSIEARGSRCHNVLRVPAWLTNGALHFPSVLRTMVPHKYRALICLFDFRRSPFLGNRGARCLCPCCLCSESSRVLETIHYISLHLQS